jgi:hypothetical protein
MKVGEVERTPAEFPLPLPFPLPLAISLKSLPEPAVGLVTEPMVLVTPESKSETPSRAFRREMELPLPATLLLPASLSFPLLLPAELSLPLPFWKIE